MDVKVHTHKCDYCEGEFDCDTRALAPGDSGAYWCQCHQEIVSDKKDNHEVARLAFWCSDECYEEEYNSAYDLEEDEGEDSNHDDWDEKREDRNAMLASIVDKCDVMVADIDTVLALMK